MKARRAIIVQLKTLMCLTWLFAVVGDSEVCSARVTSLVSLLLRFRFILIKIILIIKKVECIDIGVYTCSVEVQPYQCYTGKPQLRI